MELKLRVTPPDLLPWLTRTAKQTTVLLLDAETDLVAIDSLRLDLNIVFNPMAIRRGGVSKVDYFVGSTGAEIFIEATGGKVVDYTGPQELKVEYNNKSTRTRKSSVSLSPEIKAKAKDNEASFKPGELHWEANQDREQTVSFSCSEMTLVPVNIGDSIRWRLDTPRGDKAVRDFLMGNLTLFAECTWPGIRKTGRFGARPSDVRFFNDQRRPLSRRASLLMLFHLWRKGIKPTHDNGFDMHFIEVRE